jgi:N-acetylmuramoyl-L-alanine amidase
VDSVPYTFDDPIYINNQRLFIPVRNLVEKFHGSIDWDPVDRHIFITTPLGDTLVFTLGKAEMKFNDRIYIMDVEPFISEGRMYIPLRHAAEFLHADVNWDANQRKVSFSIVPLHIYADGDSLSLISQKHMTTEQLLRERNGYESTEPVIGDIIKVVIPDIMKQKIEPHIPEPEVKPILVIESNPDYTLLAKIIQVEAGYESYESQLAVGSVIMNRVNDPRFPNTIREVIYHPGQFPPAHNGLLDKSNPNESVLRAALAIMNGENNVVGALYFYNPKVTSGSFWDSLTLVKEIGNHRYMK